MVVPRLRVAEETRSGLLWAQTTSLTASASLPRTHKPTRQGEYQQAGPNTRSVRLQLLAVLTWWPDPTTRTRSGRTLAAGLRYISSAWFGTPIKVPVPVYRNYHVYPRTRQGVYLRICLTCPISRRLVEFGLLLDP